MAPRMNRDNVLPTEGPGFRHVQKNGDMYSASLSCLGELSLVCSCLIPALKLISIPSWIRACLLLVLFCFVLARSSAERVDYAEVRSRVSHAFEEKTHEMLETLASLQDLSRETSALLANIAATCGG